MPVYRSARDLFKEEDAGATRSYSEQFQDLVEGHEGQSILIAVATGFCVGALIGSALAGSKKESWSDRLAAEGIGRRFLNNLEQYLPRSISEKFTG